MPKALQVFFKVVDIVTKIIIGGGGAFLLTFCFFAVLDVCFFHGIGARGFAVNYVTVPAGMLIWPVWGDNIRSSARGRPWRG